MGNKKLIIIIAVSLIFLVIAVAHDQLAKKALIYYLKRTLYVDVSVDSVDLALLNSSFIIKNTEIMSPEGFEGESMFKFPLIYAHYDVSALLKGKIYLEKLAVDISEITIVKNHNGDLNIDEMRNRRTGHQPENSTENGAIPDDEGLGSMPVSIGVLRVSLKKTVLKDYSSGGEPRVNELPIAAATVKLANVQSKNIGNALSLLSSFTRLGTGSIFE